jgi:hypothetical protein
VVAREAAAFAQALPDEGMRARYSALAAAASARAVPPDLLGALETLLEMLFDTGRVSNRAVLQSVFSRTPRGRAQSAALREVNSALETLRDQTIARIRLSATGPASHSLIIETDRVRVSLDISRAGATVGSLEVG